LSDDDPAPNEIAERALVAGVHEQAPAGTRTRPARVGWWAGAALSAAAAIALLLSAPWKRETEVSVRSASIVSVEGRALSAGAQLSARGSVPEGSVVEVTTGTACFEIAPKIISCLGEGSKLAITSLEGPRRRIDLLAGRVAVALDPQKKGERFSVVAAGVWSTAVGTAFSVEIKGDGVVQTGVYEGKVLVGGEEQGELVELHKLGLASGGVVRVESMEPHTRGAEWDALERARGARYPGPEPVVVAEEPTAEKATGAVESPPKAHAEHPAPAAPTEPAEAAPKTPEEVLKRARDFRRQQDFAQAAAAYRELVREFPGAPESHAALVSLAQLELSHLGQPAKALASFDAYLARGGDLAVEAELGRIRALRALGDDAKEARAISQFLVAHPGHGEAGALRARLGELSGR
jgi:hypothetical protein